MESVKIVPRSVAIVKNTAANVVPCVRPVASARIVPRSALSVVRCALIAARSVRTVDCA